MKNKLKIIVGLFFLIGLIGGGIGYYYYSKPVKDFAKSDADYILTANTIFDEFDKDETSATLKYVQKDKTIQISGEISEIKTLDDGALNVLLKAGINPDDAVSCSIIKEDAGKLSYYKVGDKITLKGQCSGVQDLVAKEVIMIRCGIVQKS